MKQFLYEHHRDTLDVRRELLVYIYEIDVRLRPV